MLLLGLASLLIANAVSVLGAHWLTRRLSTPHGELNLVIFLIARLLLVSSAVLLAGLLQILTPLGILILALFGLVPLCALGAHREFSRARFPEVGIFTAVLASVVLARLAAQVWFFAPYAGDALSYHLPKIAEWVRVGGFTREMGIDSHATFPSGFELVEAWWVVSLHHDVLIEMAGVEFLALGVASVVALARHCGLDLRTAIFAGLFYALIPVVHLQATACLNDGPAGALVLAAAALIAFRAPLPLLLMAAGLGIGVKPIFGFAVPGLLLLAVLLRKTPPVEASSVPLARVCATLALIVGVFWYARNLLWYGSLIYPVTTEGLSGPNSIQFGISFSSLRRSLSDLLDTRILDSDGVFGPFMTKMSGWGPAVFACGGVALIATARTEPRLRNLAAAFAISLASVLACVQYDPWNLRFVLFFPAVFAIAAAKLAESSKVGSALTGLALVGCCLLTMLPKDVPLPALRVLVAQPWSSRSMAWVKGLDVPAETIGYFVDGRDPVYPWYRADFSRRVVYLRSESVDDLLAAIERDGIEYLYGAPRSRLRRDILNEAERRGVLRKVEGDIFVVAAASRRPLR